MAKTKIETPEVEEPEEGDEDYRQYKMWVTINNNSTGNVSVEIRQYGKPKDPPPHPN